MLHQGIDSDGLDSVSLGKAQTVISSSHQSILVPHNLTDHTGSGLTCQLTQINGSLGVSSSSKNTAVNGSERNNVTRSHERRSCGVLVSQESGRQGSVMCTDTSGGTLNGITGDSVSSTVSVGTVLNHVGQLVLVSQLVGERHADKTGRVSDEEGHLLGGGVGGGDDEITFVFSGLIVHDDKKLAVFCVSTGTGGRRS